MAVALHLLGGQRKVRDSPPMSSPPSATTSTLPASAKLFQVREVLAHLTEKPPLVLGVILMVIPVLYAVAYGRGSGAAVMLMAILSLSLITAAGGLVTGAINAPIFAVLAAGTCVAPGRPLVATAIAVAIAFWCSFGTASGRAVLVMTPCSILCLWIMVPPQVVHGSSAHALHNVIAVFAYALLAALWGVGVGLLLRRGRTIPHIPGAPWRWALMQGTLVAVVLGLAAGVATARHLGQGGAWLVLTVFLVFKPLTPHPWVRSFNRSLGTLVGVAIAAIYVWSLPTSAPSLTLLFPAALFLAGAAQVMVAGRWPYWCFVTVLTPGVVLLVAATTPAAHPVAEARTLDFLRIEYSLVGIAIALIAQGLLIGIMRLVRDEESWVRRSASEGPAGA